jgi:hypothetical protein
MNHDMRNAGAERENFNQVGRQRSQTSYFFVSHLPRRVRGRDRCEKGVRKIAHTLSFYPAPPVAGWRHRVLVSHGAAFHL